MTGVTDVTQGACRVHADFNTAQAGCTRERHAAVTLPHCAGLMVADGFFCPTPNQASIHPAAQRQGAPTRVLGLASWMKQEGE